MASKFNFSDLIAAALRFGPELLKLGPYFGVAIKLSRDISEDLKADGDSVPKMAADAVVDVLDDIGPLVIANNPKFAPVFQQLFSNLRKTADDFAQSGV